MIKIKQIERFSFNNSTLISGQLFSYDANLHKFENNISYTSNYVNDTLIARDSNGRSKVNDPSDPYDIVNLRTLDNYINDSNIFSQFENTNSISFVYDSVNSKIQANVIAGGQNGDIQKNVSGNLSPATYLKENTNTNTFKILKTSAFLTENSTNPLVYIGQVKYGADSLKSDFVIETSCYDLSSGPLIQIYANKNANNQSVLTKTSVANTQSLFNIEIYGATSPTTTSKAFNLQVFANSNFSSSISSHFELTQVGTNNVDLILSSNVSGDILFGNGIKVGNTSNDIEGFIRYDGTHFQGYNGTLWLDLDLSSSSLATTTNITATLDLGGINKGDVIPIGTVLEDFINKLVAPYIQPYFDSFIINYTPYGQYLEIGRVLTVDSATWSAVNDSDGNQPSNISITGVGFLSNPVTISPQPATDISNVNLTISNPVAYSWVISGLDRNSISISNTYTVYGRHRFSFGASSTILDISSIDSDITTVVTNLQQMWLMEGHVKTVTCTSDNKNPSNYTYIAYNTSYGAIVDIDKSGLDVIGAFTMIKTFNYTNPYGNVSTYYLYKSNTPGAFASGNTLIIN